MTLVEEQVEKLQAGHQRLSDVIMEMSAKLDKNNEMTGVIAEAFANAKGFFNTLAWAGRSMVFIGKFVVLPVVGVGVLVYMATHNGELPPFWGKLLKFLLEGV